MDNNYNNPTFKKLLKKLQEESWQLELLISGFSIFGLFTAFPIIEQNLLEAQDSQQIYLSVIFSVCFVSCSILIFNLILHVLLRGLWIGTLGLRYVFGDINYENLNYSEKFTKFLKQKVGSFDKYIATLENYCSVIFAISFLLIFYILAITSTIAVLILLAKYLVYNDNLPIWLSKGVGSVVTAFIIIGMLISFIDFISQGFLKRKKWTSKLYFPFYTIFSFITLSFLYRPIVYNFLDNKFGKRLSFLLIPLYMLILFISTLGDNQSNYLNPLEPSGIYSANDANYEDMLITKDALKTRVVIQSIVITDSYLKVFIPFSKNIETNIFNYNLSLKPKKDKRGIKSGISINTELPNENYYDADKQDSLKLEYLKTFNKIYALSIDSTSYKTDFIQKTSDENGFGFVTYLGIKNLQKGKHILKVERINGENNNTINSSVTQIPFWYYED